MTKSYCRSPAKLPCVDKELFTRECSTLVSIFKATVYVRVMNNETGISHRQALVWQR